MTDWQPIKTAPTDGTKFLAFDKGLALESGSPIHVCWMEKNEPDYHDVWVTWDYTVFPTHWMPLTEPPKDAE